MSAEDGYCRNGVHFVGDDHCEKCDEFEKWGTKLHVFFAAADAYRLRAALGE